MKLPKINQPIYSINIPSTGKELKIRPFTVKEEKLLMMAKQAQGSNSAENKKAIANVYRQMITNCTIGEIDVDELASFDIEYIFIQLRSKSVSNIIEAKTKDDEDGNTYDIEIDLDKIAVNNVKSKKERSIMLTPELGVVLRYPTFKDLLDAEEVVEKDKTALLRTCIESAFDQDSVYPFSEASAAEIDEFIMSLGPAQLEKIMPFFSEFPKVGLDISYMRADKTVVKKRLEGIDHFFG